MPVALSCGLPPVGQASQIPDDAALLTTSQVQHDGGAKRSRKGISGGVRVMDEQNHPKSDPFLACRRISWRPLSIDKLDAHSDASVIEKLVC